MTDKNSTPYKIEPESPWPPPPPPHDERKKGMMKLLYLLIAVLLIATAHGIMSRFDEYVPPEPVEDGLLIYDDRLTVGELTWLFDHLERAGGRVFSKEEYEQWLYAGSCDSFSYDTSTNEARAWGYRDAQWETLQCWIATENGGIKMTHGRWKQ